MFHYLFEDYETGEEFLVGADSPEEAIKIAEENFSDPELQYEVSDYEAEISGLDEY